MSIARCGLFALGWLAAVALAGPVHEYRLDNGLKLVVKEDHRAPVVVSQIWYHIGANYEHGGITGISHVLEHMMFNGTRAHGPGEFSRIIAENGGRENAFTSRDYTAYFQRLERSRLPVAFELEADRMRNLRLLPKEFRKEVQVVMEERRMRTDDKPESLTYERFNAVAFLNSPQRIPTIGWPDDLRHLRLSDLRQWYRRWYAPNNATLVVVGDVDPAWVLKLAKRYYGPIRPSDIEPPKPQHEIVQRGERRLTVRVPAEVPYVIMGYKVPSLGTAPKPWEAYALAVAAAVLDGGDSARLSHDLVRGRQIAASAGAGYDLYGRMDTLFLLDGNPAPGQDTATLERALRREVHRLAAQPVSAAELERVKAGVVAENVFRKDSMFYQGMQIGILESLGLGWRRMDEYVDRIQAVTAAQVQAVARKYFDDDHLTVAVLKPLPLDARTRTRQRAAARRGGSDVQ